METQNAHLVLERSIDARLSIISAPPKQCINDTAFVVLASLVTDPYPSQKSSADLETLITGWSGLALFRLP